MNKDSVDKNRSRVSEETKVIGFNLRCLRKCAGLSQKEIGHVLGITSQQVQKYEGGDNRISAEKIYSLKNFYDIPYNSFFEGMNSPGQINPNSLIMPNISRLFKLKDPIMKDKIHNILKILLE